MLNFDNDLNAISDALIESKKAYYYDTGGGYTFFEDSEQEVFVPYEEFDRFKEAICTMKFPDDLYYINFTLSEGYFALGYDAATECYKEYLDEAADHMICNLNSTIENFEECISEYKNVIEILIDKEFYERRYKYHFKSYTSFLTYFKVELFDLSNQIDEYQTYIKHHLEEIIDIEESCKGILVFEKIA